MDADSDSGTGYSSWASCGLRSSVTKEEVKEMAPGIRMISTISMTLCALDERKATIDLVVRNRIEGTPAAIPESEVLQMIEIPATLQPASEEDDLSAGLLDDGGGTAEVSIVRWPDPATDRSIQQGEETLQIAGRSVACRWLRREIDLQGRRMTLQVWMSEEIPGGFARGETRTDGDAPTHSVSVVTTFEKKPTKK